MAGKSLSDKVIERVVLTSVGKATNKFADRIFGWLDEQVDDKKKKNRAIKRHDPNIDELEDDSKEEQ